MRLKRILSLILTINIIAASFSSVIQISAQTDEHASIQSAQVTTLEDDGMQTASRPVEPTKEFTISNKGDFAKFMITPKLWENNYKITLTRSINMCYETFKPIEEFSGFFDGYGYTVSNIFIEDSCDKNLNIGSAFINTLNEYAEIKNIKFYNYNIGGEFDLKKIAMLALTNHGIISCVDIMNKGIDKIYEKTNSAGFVVTNYGKITKCSTAISVNNKDEAGGFVGKNFGFIENCISKGEIYSKSCAGGFCGINIGEIISCKSECNVTSKSDFLEHNTTKCGGFIGINEKGKIYDCSSTGSTTGEEYVGGFCGDNKGEITKCGSEGKVESKTIIMKSRCGGFVATNTGNVKDCNSAGSVIGKEYVGGFCGDNKGEIVKSNSEGSVKAKTTIMKSRCGGFVGANSGNVKDCNSAGSTTGEEYIGGFCGDNKGKIASSKSKGDSEIIEDIINTNRCGGFVGCNDNKGNIEDCESAGNAIGEEYIGGFCGDNKGKIAGSTSKGNAKIIEGVINTNMCGGFIGKNAGVVNDCTSIGSAIGQEYVGGFAGVNKSNIIDCNATGKATAKTVTHTALAGGFVGENEKGTIIGCKATGGADARSTSSQAKAGGFVGINKASIIYSKAGGYVYLSAGTCYKDDGCGGFVGRNDQDGSIDGCYAECIIETTNKKKGGGLVGEAKSKSTIINSKFKSKILTKSGIKNNKKFCQDKDKKAVIKDCYIN